MKDIATILNDEGLRTNKGKLWSTSQISYILKNEAYIGHYSSNRLTNQRVWRGEHSPDEQLRFENVHEAIVDEKLFAQVQKKLSQRGMTKKYHPRVVGGRYRLTPLVICSECGASYQGATAKGGKYNYYTCRTKVKKGTKMCSSKSIPVDVLEDSVFQAVKDVVLVDTAFIELVQRTNQELQKLHANNGSSIRVYEKQLKAESKKLEKLYDALETGKLEVDDLAPRIRELKAGICDLEEKKRSAVRLIESQEVLKMSEDQIKDCVQSLREVLDSSPSQKQKAFIHSFIKEIKIEGNLAHIDYTFPINDLITEDNRELVLSMEGNGVADGA